MAKGPNMAMKFMTAPRRLRARPARAATTDADPQVAQAWRALRIVLIGAFMAILDTFIVLVAAPAIQSGLHASDADIQFIFAGYQLAYAACLVMGARLGDRYGRKRLFMGGMAVFTVASLACGLAPDTSVIIAARLIQGIGAALMFPQVFSMIQVLIPESHRPKALGTLFAVIGTSTMAGQLIGGGLISANLFGSHWRPVFLVNVPIGLITLALAARTVPETRSPQATRLDPFGVAALTAALSLLVVPLVWGRQADWSAWIWLCLACSPLAFAVFGVVERRGEARGTTPLISLGLVRGRTFLLGIGLVLAAYTSVNSFFFVLSLTLQDGMRLSAISAGLVYTPEAVTFFAVSMVAGRLAPRYGSRMLAAGAIILVVAYGGTIAAAALAGSGLNAAEIIPTLVAQGVGGALVLTPLFATILSRLQPAAIGMASGLLSTAQQIGGALGVAIIGVVFFGSLTATASTTGSYAHALAIGVVVNIAGAAVVGVLVPFLPVGGGRPPAAKPSAGAPAVQAVDGKPA